MVTAYTCEALEFPRFDSESGKTNAFKISIHSFPALRSALKGRFVKQAGNLRVLPCGRHLMRFSDHRVVDRRPATPKRARYSALIAFSATKKK